MVEKKITSIFAEILPDRILTTLGFYYLSKILKGTKLIHLACRKE